MHPEEASGRPDGPPAVVHARFLLGRELREGLSERRVEEDRVVAEAVAPAWRIGDDTIDESLGRVLAAGRIHERDDAAEARRPLGGRDVAERLEEQGAPARVVEPRAAEPRRAHAGRGSAARGSTT